MKKILLSVFALASYAGFGQWAYTTNNTAQECTTAFGKALASDVTGSGLNSSSDDGATWAPSNTGIPSTGVSFGTFSGSSLYAFNNNTVYASTTGNNWTAQTGITAGQLVKSMTALNGSVIASTSPNSPVSFKIWQLNGSSWALKSSPTNSVIVTCIRNLNGTLFAGTTASSVIKSSDGGMTFSGAATGMPTENINKYIKSFACTSSILFCGTIGGKICKSTDAGATWSTVYNIGDNNGFYGINDFYVYSPTQIFAATDSGFVYSLNSGTSWLRYNTGLNFSNYENLMTRVTVSGNYIVASVKTSSSGRIVRLPLGQIITGAGIAETNLSNVETRIYPNPASNYANVEVSDLMFESNCEIKLFDGLGREVGAYPLTEGKAQLSLEKYNSGMYSYTVSHNKSVVSRGKLMVN